MKLGAQLFSVRSFLKTEEDLKETFAKIKSIGYENVQLSGAPQMDPFFFEERIPGERTSYRMHSQSV